MNKCNLALESIRRDENEAAILALKIMFTHIYGEKVSYHLLTKEEKNEINMWVPRYQSEHFPEHYPDETGYTGDYWEVYRGLYFHSEEMMDKYMDTIIDGCITTEDITSWSIDEGVAEEFARGAGISFYEKQSESFGSPTGLILKIERLRKEPVFFSGYEAHQSFFEYFSDFEEWKNKTKTFEREEEFILLPGTYQVQIEKIIRM